MTKKRFELKINQHDQCDIVDWVESKEKNVICVYNDLGCYYFSSAKALCDLLNKLAEENQRLKSQLYYDEEEGVCNICKYHYLIKDDKSELGYYNSRCKKGHYECARVSLKYCEDFEKELEE